MVWLTEVAILAPVVGAVYGYLKTAEHVTLRKKVKSKEGVSLHLGRTLALEERRHHAIQIQGEENFLSIRQWRENLLLSVSVHATVVFLMTSACALLIPSVSPVIITSGVVIGHAVSRHRDLTRATRKALPYINELVVLTPPEYKQYGMYSKNPFDVTGMLDEITNNTKRQQELLKQQTLEHEMDSGEDSETQLALTWIDSTLSSTNESLRRGGFLVDEVPSYVVQEVIDANEFLPIEEIKEVTKTFSETPPHIRELMKIASNPGLPPEITSRAERLIVDHDDTNKDRKQQEEIQEALATIETVEKYYASEKLR